MAITEERRAPRAGALPATVTVSSADGYALVRLEGEFDIASRYVLSDSLAGAMTLDDGDLVVDLSGVQFMGAETVDLLIRGRSFLRARSRDLIVRSPSPSARRILDLCGLAHTAASSAADS